MNKKPLKKARNARSNSNGRLYIPICVFSFLLVSVVIFNYYYEEMHTVKVKINGDKHVYLSVNSKYEDAGVILKDNGENAKPDDIVINSNIEEKLGEYEVNYIVTYKDKKYETKRLVTVIDDVAPVIYVNNNKVLSTTCGNDLKNNLIYEAIDNIDGVITNKVEVLEEEDKYVLTVKDTSGNKSSVSVLKDVDGLNNYRLELNGKLVNYVLKDTEYVDEGALLTDICGNSIDGDILIDGSVDTSKVGLHTIKYSYGENLSAIRFVYVYEKSNYNVKTFNDEKVVYLTFDDGPGKYTETLLDILKKYNVKATFFVTGQFKSYIPLIERENSEGHVVAVHTYTHNWDVYRSYENYISDFKKMSDTIYEYTGKRSEIFRFPGGVSNTISKGKSKGIMGYLSNKMLEDGYEYFDWNVDSEDAAGATSSQIYKNVTTGIANRNYSVVLMHDIKEPTINAIEKIINYCIDNGYTFDTLSKDSTSVHHHVNN